VPAKQIQHIFIVHACEGQKSLMMFDQKLGGNQISLSIIQKVEIGFLKHVEFKSIEWKCQTRLSEG